ncbi:MAG: His/Gly/Thr/Pro-type tRNA ligase C-terminal domain-containing protein, partial [Gammaproteobacteria bacterium]
PECLGAQYVDERSARRHPVMLHRAIVGSMERFIGILIEHYAGRLPPWLAPVQAVVLAIGEGEADYAREVAAALAAEGFRVETDLRNETISYKIRTHTLDRTPYLLVVGEREREGGTVAVRTRAGSDLGAMKVSAFTDRLVRDVAAKGEFQAEE